MWTPEAGKRPPWAYGRHYVTATEAEQCDVWEALYEEPVDDA